MNRKYTVECCLALIVALYRSHK